jgi:hypothetical protein
MNRSQPFAAPPPITTDFRIQDVDHSRESDPEVRPGPSKNLAAQWIAIDPVLIDRRRVRGRLRQ